MRGAPARVIDLGCGTGRLTAVMHQRLGARSTLGIDSSPAMLRRCAALSLPGLQFLRADIASFVPEAPFDLVVSNAVLQWLPDHDQLFARLSAQVAPRGQLAVQLPANFDHPSHSIASDVAREAPFAEALGGYVREPPVRTPEHYARLLHELGFAEQHVRLQVYGHVLASTREVSEWTRGTLLTDYEARLPEPLFAPFFARYRERLAHALGEQTPYFYPFKRLLMWAQRG